MATFSTKRVSGKKYSPENILFHNCSHNENNQILLRWWNVRCQIEYSNVRDPLQHQLLEEHKMVPKMHLCMHFPKTARRSLEPSINSLLRRTRMTNLHNLNVCWQLICTLWMAKFETYEITKCIWPKREISEHSRSKVNDELIFQSYLRLFFSPKHLILRWHLFMTNSAKLQLWPFIKTIKLARKNQQLLSWQQFWNAEHRQ